MKSSLLSFLLSAFLLSLLALGGCSSSRNTSSALPAWVDNPAQSYSASRFLMAVGSGSTLQEAHESALGSLSRIFQADIDASRELIDEFIESSRNEEFSSERTTQLLNVTRIGSSQELMNTRILESAMGDNGTWYALAGMNRAESVQIYNQEISRNDLRIHEQESGAEQEKNLLQKLVLLKKALVLCDVNENLTRQRNILLGGSAGTGLNTQTQNRIREQFRIVRQQVPVAINTDTAPEIILSSLAGVFQQAGFHVGTGTGTPLLEVRVDYLVEEADLNRENMEFVKWELIINIVDRQADRTFQTYIREGRDGAFSYGDALKRADFSVRENIENEFKKFLNQELLALN